MTELDGKKIFDENGAAYSAPDQEITDKNRSYRLKYIHRAKMHCQGIYEKTLVGQNKSNLLLKNQMYNMSILLLIQLKMD